MLEPSDLSRQISEQIDLVDRAPHAALLYGAHPDNDARPQPLIETITGIHARKIAGLATVLKDMADDLDLVRAYASKIIKESAAAGFSPTVTSFGMFIQSSSIMSQPLTRN